MDATRMFPQGFHPVHDIVLYDMKTFAPVIPRLDAGVKYYFVDYGISSSFPSGSRPQLVLGRAGRDQDVPELSDTVPYDPFKVDIFTIGNVLRLEFQDVGFTLRLLTSLSHIFAELLQPRILHALHRVYDTTGPKQPSHGRTGPPTVANSPRSYKPPTTLLEASGAQGASSLRTNPGRILHVKIYSTFF